MEKSNFNQRFWTEGYKFPTQTCRGDHEGPRNPSSERSGLGTGPSIGRGEVRLAGIGSHSRRRRNRPSFCISRMTRRKEEEEENYQKAPSYASATTTTTTTTTTTGESHRGIEGRDLWSRSRKRHSSWQQLQMLWRLIWRSGSSFPLSQTPSLASPDSLP